MAVLVAAMMIMATMVPAFADPTPDAPGAFTITYDVNGGTAISDGTGTDAGTVTLPSATRSADTEGRKFVFLGWTEQDYEHVYSAGEASSLPTRWAADTTIDLTGNKTVHAVWGYDLNKTAGADVLEAGSAIAISYDLNGGTGTVPSAVAVPANSTYVVSSAAAPTRTNHIFLGWKAVDSTGSRPVDIIATNRSYDSTADGLVQPGGDLAVTTTTPLTLYAVWADNDNGGTTPDYQEILVSVTYNLGLKATKDDVVRTILKSDGTTPLATSDITGYVNTENNIVPGATYTLKTMTSPAGTLAKYDVEDKSVKVALIGWTTNKDASWKIYDAGDRIDGFIANETDTVPAGGKNYWAVWGKDDDGDGTPNYKETPNSTQDSTNTIIIDNAKDGETYRAYRMLKLIVNNPTNPQAYAYRVDEDWVEFFANTTGAWADVLEVTDEGYFIKKTADPAVPNEQATWIYNSVLSNFAEEAAAYVAEKGWNTNDKADAYNVAASGKATLTTTESGYYLVTSTIGTRAMIDTTPGNIDHMKEKNSVDSIEKTVQEDSTEAWGSTNDAQVGDTVNFRSVATIAARSINVKIHDKMDDGLTVDPESIKVFTNDGYSVEYKDAQIKTGAAADSGDDFTIVIPDSFAAKTEGDAYLYISYSAELNQAAVDDTDVSNISLVPQVNKTWVKFGDVTVSEEEIITTTTTHSFTVFKHAHESSECLDGAVFELQLADGTVVNLVKIDDTNYRVADSTDTATPQTYVADDGEDGLNTISDGAVVKDFVTVSSAKIIIWGVDADAYKLKEIQAPLGYHLPDDAFDITVLADNTYEADIENLTSSELPSTGGMGTTVLYIVGGMLVILAGAYLFFSRKKTA